MEEFSGPVMYPATVYRQRALALASAGKLKEALPVIALCQDRARLVEERPGYAFPLAYLLENHLALLVQP